LTVQRCSGGGPSSPCAHHRAEPSCCASCGRHAGAARRQAAPQCGQAPRQSRAPAPLRPVHAPGPPRRGPQAAGGARARRCAPPSRRRRPPRPGSAPAAPRPPHSRPPRPCRPPGPRPPRAAARVRARPPPPASGTRPPPRPCALPGSAAARPCWSASMRVHANRGQQAASDGACMQLSGPCLQCASASHRHLPRHLEVHHPGTPATRLAPQRRACACRHRAAAMRRQVRSAAEVPIAGRTLHEQRMRDADPPRQPRTAELGGRLEHRARLRPAPLPPVHRGCRQHHCRARTPHGCPQSALSSTICCLVEGCDAVHVSGNACQSADRLRRSSATLGSPDRCASSAAASSACCASGPPVACTSRAVRLRSAASWRAASAPSAASD
jgi:hypothetical protein